MGSGTPKPSDASPAATPEVIWEPPADARHRSRMGRRLRWLEQERDLVFEGYDDAWRGSVEDLGGFWSSVWEYFDVH